VESGSRAWGFPSADSDYDVRFIYVRSLISYLSFKQPRDVIEQPINKLLDMSGWDLRKAIGLALRSNATVGEWLTSPIVYRYDVRACGLLLDFVHRNFSPRHYALHYLSFAEKQWRPHARTSTVNPSAIAMPCERCSRFAGQSTIDRCLPWPWTSCWRA
jgi:uncharacterized protein